MQTSKKTVRDALYDARTERERIVAASAAALNRLRDVFDATPRLASELASLRAAHANGLTEPRSRFVIEDELLMFRSKADAILQDFSEIEGLINSLRPRVTALTK